MPGLSPSLPARPSVAAPPVAPPASAAAPAARPAPRGQARAVVGFVALHVVLAMAMRVDPVVPTLLAIACTLAGVWIAATQPIHRVAYVIAYIAGSEVLWRMTRATVFWEFGKYATALVAVVALLRIRSPRNRGLAFGYLAMLAPSILLTLVAVSFDEARRQISFNLSGPLALTVCVLLFSNLRLTAAQIRITFLAFIGPVIGIAAIAYFSTVTAENLEFTHNSNSVTSGGFGPNQVSAVLGLGLLFALLMLLERKLAWRARVPLIGLALVLAIQTALTFSRGGLALAFAAVVAAAMYLVRDGRARVSLLLLGGLFFGVAKLVVVPRLDEFTSGKLSERYTNLNSSNRGTLAEFDLKIFQENPLLGIGPGVTSSRRQEIGFVGAAHTEYTRVLAEHGALGVIALGLLVVLAVRAIRGARTLSARAFVVAMIVWVGLFLAVNAMRIAAPAFLFGLACSVAYSSRPRPRPGVIPGGLPTAS